MTVGSRYIQSFSHLNKRVFNPEIDFPLRYFDLTNVCDIASARLGEKCAIVATLKDVETKRIFSHDEVMQLTFTDSTGVCMLNLLNPNYYKCEFEIGCNYVFSGTIETYDSEKCINNPLLKEFTITRKAEVLPVYSFDFLPTESDFEKSLFDRTLHGDYELTLRDALLALHGFKSKKELVQARRALKFDELVKCHIKCLKGRTTLKQHLLSPFKINSNYEFYSEPVRLIYRKEEGEETQAISDAVNAGNYVLIICPLAGKTTDERNLMAWDFERAINVPSAIPHPFISIENEADCRGNDEGIKRRQFQIQKLVDHGVRHLISASSGANCDYDLREDDLLIIEDADRISTLQIDFWQRQARCKTLIVSNSVASHQKRRLEFLCYGHHTQEEVLMNELTFRRDGDILGCRNAIFQELKLVNLARDWQLNEEAEGLAKDMIK